MLQLHIEKLCVELLNKLIYFLRATLLKGLIEPLRIFSFDTW